MELSRAYFADIGAQVAVKKCFLTSTCPTTRAKLRQITWDHRRTKLKVITHFRDLGAHLGLDRRASANTATTRLHKAIAKVKRLRRLPLSQAKQDPHYHNHHLA